MADEDTLDRGGRRIRFYYIKSQLFRVAHVDGVIGGLTPSGLIHIAMYSERPAIPQTTEHDISPEGQIGSPLAQEGKQGVVREIDFDVLMNREVAINLRDWLNDRVTELDKIMEAATAGATTAARKRK